MNASFISILTFLMENMIQYEKKYWEVVIERFNRIQIIRNRMFLDSFQDGKSHRQ